MTARELLDLYRSHGFSAVTLRLVANGSAPVVRQFPTGLFVLTRVAAELAAIWDEEPITVDRASKVEHIFAPLLDDLLAAMADNDVDAVDTATHALTRAITSGAAYRD